MIAQAPHSPSAQPSLLPVRPRSRNQSRVVVCGVVDSPSGTDDPLRVREAVAVLDFVTLVMIDDPIDSVFAHSGPLDRSARVCRPS